MKTKALAFVFAGSVHIYVFTCTYTRPSQLYFGVCTFSRSMDNTTHCAFRAFVKQSTGQPNLLGFTRFLDKKYSHSI